MNFFILIFFGRLPMLRCLGVFFHVVSTVPAPEELRSSVWVPESEYFCLLRYLGLGSSLSQALTPLQSAVPK